MKSSDIISTIVLAAGSSSRLGTSKQLLRIQGESLLVRTIKASIASNANQTIVVLGANAEAHLKATAQFNIDMVINGNWETGMGSSLKTGLQFALKLNPAITAVVVVVCDQPLLSSDHLNELIRIYLETEKKIVGSHYGGSDGVPALFAQSHFKEILSLNNNEGAKKIIQSHLSEIARVEFPSGEFDIDTQEDYQRFLKNNSGGYHF
jgi:molybdenum cofactor cytidylyltransferase